MKICRFDGGRLGLVEGDEVVDVTDALAVLPTATYPFPRHDALVADFEALKPKIKDLAATGPRKALAEVYLDLPIANPGKIIAAPVNYKKHLEEVRDQEDLNHGNAAHMLQIREIGLFLKANSSLIGPSDTVHVGKPDRRNDHEIELVAVIGKEAKNVKAADALDYVFGYSIGLDMTVRGPEDRSFRKSLDTYTVLGPWVVTADEIPDPSTLPFELTVNGETRQKAHTKDLVLGVAELIEFASSFYTLKPGDLIYTGTPEGVGEVKAGDVMHAQIDQIGDITIKVAG